MGRDNNITRGDSPCLGRGRGIIFGDGDGDEDKILSPKVDEAGTGKYSSPHLHPIPDIYIYMYIYI